jgi:hypothetical protein
MFIYIYIGKVDPHKKEAESMISGTRICIYTYTYTCIHIYVCIHALYIYIYIFVYVYIHNVYIYIHRKSGPSYKRGREYDFRHSCSGVEAYLQVL